MAGNTIETGGTGRGGVMLAISDAAFHITIITGEKKRRNDRSEEKRKTELQDIRNDNDHGHWTVHLLNDNVNHLSHILRPLHARMSRPAWIHAVSLF